MFSRALVARFQWWICYSFCVFNNIFNQKLGFASCRRNKGATEGINVLIEKKTLDDKWSYGISCIEYTEFDKFGIVEGPLLSKRYFVPSVLLTT